MGLPRALSIPSSIPSQLLQPPIPIQPQDLKAGTVVPGQQWQRQGEPGSDPRAAAPLACGCPGNSCMTELHAASIRGMSPDPQSCESSRKASGLNNCPCYHTQIFFFPASAYHPWMKLKITICGPKVHDVGEYRPCLMEMAFSLCLKGFEVFNDELDGQQSVVALIEGDDARVNRFRKIATSTQPPLASVERVLVEDYHGEIMPAWQFASICTFSQMNKAIPLLL